MTATFVHGTFFQLGYVVRDLDRAIAKYVRRCGETGFSISVPQAPDGGRLPMTRIALAYVDDVMIELIEADRAQASIYTHALPEAADAICLHHLGYLVEDFSATMAALSQQGYSVPWWGAYGAAMSYAYADTRAEFGHYCEYICLGEAGRQMFDTVPRVRRKGKTAPTPGEET